MLHLSPKELSEIVNNLLPSEETWTVQDELPFFDERLVVDTCAQLVLSSFQVQASLPARAGTTAVGAVEQPADTSADCIPKEAVRQRRLNSQVAITHAHAFTGAERFAMELVPRCQSLRSQLRQAVHPLCTEVSPRCGKEQFITGEVDRFLRSRLVRVDLAELLEYDCFKGEAESDEDVDLPEHPREETFMGRTSQVFQATRRFGSVRNPNTVIDAELVTRPSDDDHAVNRFELRFWRAFSHGLGRSLFGNSATNLVQHFEACAQDVYDRYQGDLQLSVNSIMGWLPSWISDSVFVAFLGLPVMVAAKQVSIKYVMLHRCIQTLVKTSGRYIFLHTPGWYMPLVSWLPGIGRKEMLRRQRPCQYIGLRSVWPTSCGDPKECIRMVDKLWGGRRPGERGAFGLHKGVEPLGAWVLRATLGCEALLALVVKELTVYAAHFEEAYENVKETGALADLAWPWTTREGRLRAQLLAGKLAETSQFRWRYTCAKGRSRATVINRRATRASLAEHCCGKIGSEHRLRNSNCRFTLMSTERVKVMQYMPGSQKRSSTSKRSSSHYETGDTEFDSLQTLRSLQRDARTFSTQGADQTRLRMRISTGDGTGRPTIWPIGEGSLSGRIPIHDSPDLQANAPPLLMDFAKREQVAVTSAKQNDAWGREKGETWKTFEKSALRQISDGGVHTRSFRGTGRGRSLPVLQSDIETKPQLNYSTLMDLQELQQCLRRRERAVSAPPAVDTQDFDAGDLDKNSLIALALQHHLRGTFAASSLEGPLRQAWRRTTSSTDFVYVHRERLGLAAMLLMAAYRAPLPVAATMPHHLFLHSADAEMSTLNQQIPPSAKLPDVVYSMGCFPVFYTMATKSSAKTPPLVSTAFRVGIPHSMLDPAVTRPVLVQNSGSKTHWRTGSLLVLLTVAAFEESHRLEVTCHTLKGWMAQDHESFVPLLCSFRFVLGLEYFLIWAGAQDVHPRIPLLDLLPFLRGTKSVVREAHLAIDMLAATSNAPLVAAPLVDQRSQGNERASCDTSWAGTWAHGDPPVTFQDFAAWISQLMPGRIVYSSYRSSTGDLYIRLNHIVLVIAFAVLPRSGVLDAPDINSMYKNAVGRPEWWGGAYVTYLVMCSQYSKLLQTALGSDSCVVLAADRNAQGFQDITVQPGSEIVLCHPRILSAYMGNLDSSVMEYVRSKNMYTSENSELNTSAPSGRSYRPPVGMARNAVRDWTAKRAKLPKDVFVNLNRDVLRMILDDVNQKTQWLLREASCEESQNQVVASEEERGREDEAVDDEQESCGESDSWGSEALDAINFDAVEDRLPLPRKTIEFPFVFDDLDEDSGDDFDTGKDCEDPLIESLWRLPEPEMDPDLRRRWRPPTPHPAKVDIDDGYRKLGKGVRKVKQQFPDFFGLAGAVNP